MADELIPRPVLPPGHTRPGGPQPLEQHVRNPDTDRLLAEVRAAVAAARQRGVAVRACIWDATAAAVDGELKSWHSPEARRTADGACQAVDPPTAKAGPKPPPPPTVARALFWLANRIANRAAR